MKRSENRVTLMICCLIGLMLAAGCNSKTIIQYDGDTRPLEEVAVLVTSNDTCPILKIDGEFVNLKNRPGNEYHLLPGAHGIEVLCQTWASFGAMKIEPVALDCYFKAGHVYAVKKSMIEQESPQWDSVAWTPNIQDLGDVVAYAQQNPDYRKWTKCWKQLRRDNGLTPPSFWEFKWLAKDPSPDEVQQY